MFSVLPTAENEALHGSRFFEAPHCHAVVVAGGEEADPAGTARHLGQADLVVAADGGYRLLPGLGLNCDVLVGDFDTLSAEEVEKAKEAGVRVHRFPAEKAQSDLEIAVDEAYKAGASLISFVGALGGDWDHCVANLLSPLSLCAEYGIWGRLLTSQAQIYLARGSVEVDAEGRRISLAALSEVVEELSLTGMRYTLNKERLRRTQTLGLANRVIQNEAAIEFKSGELLITLTHS